MRSEVISLNVPRGLAALAVNPPAVFLPHEKAPGGSLISYVFHWSEIGLDDDFIGLGRARSANTASESRPKRKRFSSVTELAPYTHFPVFPAALKIFPKTFVASRRASSCRCAYLCVVAAWVCPKSWPTFCKDTPLETK